MHNFVRMLYNKNPMPSSVLSDMFFFLFSASSCFYIFSILGSCFCKRVRSLSCTKSSLLRFIFIFLVIEFVGREQMQ